MKLQRLAGFGPIGAFVSAISLLVFFVLQEYGIVIAQAAPRFIVALTYVFFGSLWLWVAGATVAVFDLEWKEHPSTRTRWLQVALAAMLIALLMPAVLAVGQVTNAGVPLQAPTNFALFVGVGICLLIHNIEGRRAGLIHGVLPWLGMILSVAFIGAGIGYGSYLFPGGAAIFMTAFNVLLVAQVLYMVWAVWLGLRLSRSKAAGSALVASAAR